MTCPLSFTKKRGVVLGMRVVMYLGGELVYELFLLGGMFILYKRCSEDFLYLFISFFRYIVLTL